MPMQMPWPERLVLEHDMVVVSWIKVDPEIKEESKEGRPIKGCQDEEFRRRTDERVADLYKGDSEPFGIRWIHAIHVRAKAYKRNS